jgi:hypothetical protein
MVDGSIAIASARTTRLRGEGSKLLLDHDTQRRRVDLYRIVPERVVVEARCTSERSSTRPPQYRASGSRTSSRGSPTAFGNGLGELTSCSVIEKR